MGAVSKTEIPRPGGGRGGNERGASSKRQNGTATWVGNSSSGHLPEKVKKLTVKMSVALVPAALCTRP